jgi:hypothetical protein
MSFVAPTTLVAFLLVEPVLAQISGQSAGQSNAAMSNALYYILVTTVVAGGFGGFVHGILRRTAVHYKIRWPFLKGETAREFGFLGDILIGIAAAVTLFLVLDGIFLLNVQELTKPADNAQAWLKFIAVGVIGGYIGVGVLDAFAVAFSKKLAQRWFRFFEQNFRVDKWNLCRD